MVHGYEAALDDDKEADQLLEDLKKGPSPDATKTPSAPDDDKKTSSPEPPAPPVAEPAKKETAEPDKDKIIASLERALATEKHNFQSLKGKFDAEVPRYATEVKQLKADLKAAQDTIADLMAQIQQNKTSVTATAGSHKFKQMQDKLGLDDDGANALNDIVNEQIQDGVKAALAAMGIKPETAATREPKPIAANPDPGKESDGKESEPNLSESSWSVIDSYVPDYAETCFVNGTGDKNDKFSPEYLMFLAGPDAKTGYLNRDLLEMAVRANDPFRFIAIVNAFKATRGAGTERPRRPIAPNTGGKPGKGTHDKPTYSRKEAEAAYKYYQSNIKSMDDEEAKKYQAMFAAYEQAEQEGRLV